MERSVCAMVRTLSLAAVVVLGASAPVHDDATSTRSSRFQVPGDSTLASDDFNRTNETPISGNWTSTAPTTLVLASNQVVPPSLGSDGEAYYSGMSWPNDQYSKAKLSVTGTGGATQGVGLLVRRAASATTHYRLAVDHASSDNVSLMRAVAGSYTSLATFTQSWTDGDVWELRVTGTVLQVFRNDSQVGTDVTDCAIVSGSAGIAYSSTETAAAIDDWEGGAVTTVATAAWPHEPPGFAAFKNTDFTAFPTDGWSSNGATIVTDSTAPVSPTYQVIQWEYDTTLEAGTSPGTVYNDDFDHVVDAYFVGFYFKLSDPFDLGVNGVGMWLPQATAHYAVGFSPESTIVLQVALPDSVYNLHANIHDPTLALGVWHRFEHYFQPASSPTAHDGILRWWIDGVLCGDYTDVQWPSPEQNWVEWQYWSGWGGEVDSHPVFTSYQWVDRIYLSQPITGMLASDDFTRANEAPLGGHWTTTGSWPLALESNRVVPSNLDADAEAFYSGLAWPNDQYSKAKLSVTGAAGEDQGIGLVVRHIPSPTKTFYRVVVDHADSGNVGLSKQVANAYTSLATSTQSWTDGDVWELRVTGTTLRIFVNDTQVGTDVTDSAIAFGYPGLGYSSTDSGVAVDDWEGGGILTDHFTRENETPIAGNWTTAPALPTSEALALTATHVRPTSVTADGEAYYSGVAWPNNQYSQARLCVDGTAGGDQGIGLLVRQSAGAVTHYRLAVDHASSNNVGLSKHVAGTYTTLASFTQSWTDFDRVPTPTALAVWVTQRLQDAELEQPLKRQFAMAVDRTQAADQVSVATYSRWFRHSGPYTARDWRAIARLCRHAQGEGAAWQDEERRGIRLRMRTAMRYASKYLQVSHHTLRKRLGWEWVLEAALRVGGYV